ncbi:neuropeptide F receptor [Eurytemora carolleeae]|uniref:neuropeptide F receptor n=1 Tax=Eurytemora carolleeae TaxID=1294199 RepID=UPI000C77DE4E|nr:neuropeptide F receptor [Eurytemora carolleeae]|eukprot:XP_023342725.1 neuropeptide F receptor-like [Eurytemora affinis]
MVTLAIAGNSLVLLAVSRCKKLRTSSNWFLVNLATSDLINVCISCPETLSLAVTKHWILPPGGLSVFLCTMSGFLPMFCSFLSTFTITSIALDRYNIIIHSLSGNSGNPMGRTLVYLGVSWSLAFLFSSPQLFSMQFNTHTFKTPQFTLIRSYCLEEWAWKQGRLYYSIYQYSLFNYYILGSAILQFISGRLYYSISVLCIQLLLPATIITLAHTAIHRKLASMPMRQRRQQQQQERQQQQQQQQPKRSGEPHMDRTQKVLILVILVFSISWLPLNLLNLLRDVGISISSGLEGRIGDILDRIIFSIVHILAMSSAVSNPIIYSYFNQGFRVEFKRLTGRNHIATPPPTRTQGSHHQRRIEWDLENLQTDFSKISSTKEARVTLESPDS